MTLIFSQEQLWNHQKPGWEGPCWIHHQFQLPWLQIVHSYAWCQVKNTLWSQFLPQETQVLRLLGNVALNPAWSRQGGWFIVQAEEDAGLPVQVDRLGWLLSKQWGIMGNVFQRESLSHRDGMLAVVVQLLIRLALNRLCVWAPSFIYSHTRLYVHTRAHTRIIFTQISWLINKWI